MESWWLSTVWVLLSLCAIEIHIAVCSSDGFKSNSGFGDVIDALGSFAELMGDLDECEYECKNGATPRNNPRHKPSSNGCGSYGLQVDVSAIPAAADCCDAHDHCYDTCSSGKQKCDSTFKQCLENICTTAKKHKLMNQQMYSGCKTTAKMLYGAAMGLGCEAYKDAQSQACLCDRTTAGSRKKLSRDEI